MLHRYIIACVAHLHTWVVGDACNVHFSLFHDFAIPVFFSSQVRHTWGGIVAIIEGYWCGKYYFVCCSGPMQAHMVEMLVFSNYGVVILPMVDAFARLNALLQSQSSSIVSFCTLLCYSHIIYFCFSVQCSVDMYQLGYVGSTSAPWLVSLLYRLPMMMGSIVNRVLINRSTWRHFDYKFFILSCRYDLTSSICVCPLGAQDKNRPGRGGHLWRYAILSAFSAMDLRNDECMISIWDSGSHLTSTCFIPGDLLEGSVISVFPIQNSNICGWSRVVTSSSAAL